jgi:16S rRNA (uracil1498-N3)-methyltransferase
VNIIPLTAADFVAPDQCTLHGERARHVREVLKSAVGDTLKVGLLDGLLGSATITGFGEDGSIVLAVQLSEPPPAPLPLTLLLALPRPKMLGRLLRDVTSLGVKQIHLFQSEKVEKSYWQTPSLAPAYVHDKLVEGLAQARDTVLPAIHQHRRFSELVADVLPALLQTHTGVIADPFSPGATIGPQTTPLALAIGPEGGFTPQERQQLLDAGCQPLWLGSRILRVETAVHVAIGRLGPTMPASP